ncbi:hypothetical protein SAMN06265349_105115 [Flavobacterium resistens]|uniref:Uncharacterized protein n=1 Tax=Flavobacterium resistens TaxID=443612 RepID=A0A521ENC7_9FLAO|nr:hypothetical protein [Flavobacterium resistens]MRX67742.1 hypothetical protein [Flavobacterium resistens]SMO85426.1 hypothetical protein SAMN06265349_105115 [Flavobacterium resistens]
MKRNSKMLMLSVLCLTVFSACDEQSENASGQSNKENAKLEVNNLYDSNSNLKREFGKALVKSLSESKSLRDLIKNESLKMFDNDYEVLYQMIKDEKLENNLTVRQSILQNLGNEDLLNKIELNNPTLTILVPELPENSFSAKLWDTQNQIPKVAISLHTSNDVPIINLDGSEEIIKAQYIPSFPVIVLKDNERIVINNNSTNKNLKTNSVAVINGTSYKFLDDCFDGSKKINNTARIVVIPALDPTVVTAFNTYTALNVDGWQRDYIYYGITPNTPKGPFKYDFQETIKTFSLEGDLASAHDKISDQTGDPNLPVKAISGNIGASITSWTGGNYEFKIRIIVNGKNGVGSEIIKYFNARVQDLFDFNYVMKHITVYERRLNGFKKMNLNIPIFNWDLDQYASTIKIDIEEMDLTETTVLTESRAVEFASNFGVEVSGSIQEYVKIGLKYGTSQKVNTTSTVQRTFTQGNDLLGDVIVNFADNVIISRQPNTYTTREYSSGLYSITVEPIRVQ